jgi:fatty acid desaturase
MPGRVLRDVALRWGLILGGWTLLHLSGSPNWMIPIVSAWTGINFYALFIIGHDGMHRRHSRSVVLNDAINDVLVLAPMFALTRRNRTNHMLHHALLALPEDPDRYKYERSAKRSRAAFIAELTGMTMLISVVKNVFLRRAAVAPGQSRVAWSLRDCAILLVVNATLISGLTFVFGWWGYVLLWLIPVYVFVYCADLLRTYLEHATLAEESNVEKRLSTFDAPWWERQLFAPMNMNCHCVHHLYPSIPYFNLAEADALARQRLECGSGPVVRGSYVRHLQALFKELPQAQRVDPARLEG